MHPALLLLLAAVIHEFAWQAFPIHLQGDIRYVTLWPLICSALWMLHMVRDRFLSAVCAAVAVMTSTTAGCSAWWLMTRFVVEPGQEQCSKQWGLPMALLSAAAACAVFWRWPNGKQR